MAAAWELDIPSTEKMVLLCLCDFANDDGKCWPAVGTIATKCSKGERTVQKALASLESMGFLTRKEACGTSTRYYLNPRKICTPAENAPPQVLTQTPAKVAPKPSRTTNDFPNGKHTRAKGWPEIPSWVPVANWNAYLKMRKTMRKWPTDDAVKLMLGKLRKWHDAGHDLAAILDNSTENNWTGLFEPKGTPANDYRKSNSGSNTAALARQKLGLG